MTIAPIEYIEVDDRGIAKLFGHRIKVMHLVMTRMTEGGGPEEVHAQFPHLKLSQVYAAFAYYYDHKEQVGAQIEESRRVSEEMRAAAGESPAVKKLRAMGKLPSL
jgi:uncharacterized protein (DUF433 family)